jgi:hypothetical protein
MAIIRFTRDEPDSTSHVIRFICDVTHYDHV